MARVARPKVILFAFLVGAAALAIVKVDWKALWYRAAYREDSNAVLQTSGLGGRETHLLNVFLTRRSDVLPGPYKVLLQYDEQGHVAFERTWDTQKQYESSSAPGSPSRLSVEERKRLHLVRQEMEEARKKPR